ncbi:GNAT family N-acetyltransferase [Xanthomonadaceae bacterium JHOS43]|nr:GNAT family N-acetyltransferase [Xanthomonadaceae bacterium JHOS43]
MTATLTLADSLARVPADAWDALHDGTNPFVSHAFLDGLERTGCLRPEWGWMPRHVLLHENGQLIAAAPGYRKDNSHGEFVFDHAWAMAYARAGFDYYPKWLIGVPYSPVTGPRLLARDARARDTLLDLLIRESLPPDWSSAHVNFLPAVEASAFDDRWLAREDVQFHWQNPSIQDASGADVAASARWHDFAGFLDAMTHKRRKSIRQERDKVRRAGYTFRTLHGEEASDADLAAMHDFYCMTFSEKGNSPALTLAFFRHLARTMPRSLILIFADHHARCVAGAFFLRGADTLYGRYWGSEHHAPGLHFETCYYQGIEYCLREGLRRFEPGAQGEHKLARGFLPVTTHSRHFIADPQVARALAPWCAHERQGAHHYRELLLQHSPFRDPTATT